MEKTNAYYRRWFNNLWESNANEYDFFELAKAIIPSITFNYFDRGWQYTTILNKDKNYAWNEFQIAIYGCY